MLRPVTSLPPIPEETARAARGAFPKGNVYVWLRDELDAIFRDEDFADLYAEHGQPGLPAWRLALVCVMQYLEDRTDRETAEQVRSRIDWKYALSLPLDDSGFDYSVLSEFRQRLVSKAQAHRFLERLLERCQAKGWLHQRDIQRTDSTHVLASIRRLNRLEAVGEMLRAALNEVAGAAPEWLIGWLPQSWFDRYSHPIEDYHLPRTASARTAYAEQVGADGLQLLEHLWQETTPSRLQRLEKVEHLRQFWVHQYYVEEGVVKLRPTTDMPPSGNRLDSPYDPDARYGHKRSEHWEGYKVHVSESCEPNQVHLITDVQTTSAQIQDIEQTAVIHAALARQNLLPRQHFVDAGYVDADLLVSAHQTYGIDLIGPVRNDTSWQAQQAEAYDLSQFTIDWQQQQVTCPQHQTSQTWQVGQDARYQTPLIRVRFKRADCQACPTRSLCTRAAHDARGLTLQPQAQQQALDQARQQQSQPEWWQQYHTRAGIEGTISQAVIGFGLRQSRYRGLAKTHLQHVITAVAINVRRLFRWQQGIPHARAKPSRFAALEFQAA